VVLERLSLLLMDVPDFLLNDVFDRILESEIVKMNAKVIADAIEYVNDKVAEARHAKMHAELVSIARRVKPGACTECNTPLLYSNTEIPHATCAKCGARFRFNEDSRKYDTYVMQDFGAAWREFVASRKLKEAADAK
jgi:RNase P subunit RPR2